MGVEEEEGWVDTCPPLLLLLPPYLAPALTLPLCLLAPVKPPLVCYLWPPPLSPSLFSLSLSPCHSQPLCGDPSSTCCERGGGGGGQGGGCALLCWTFSRGGGRSPIPPSPFSPPLWLVRQSRGGSVEGAGCQRGDSLRCPSRPASHMHTLPPAPLPSPLAPACPCLCTPLPGWP